MARLTLGTGFSDLRGALGGVVVQGSGMGLVAHRRGRRKVGVGVGEVEGRRAWSKCREVWDGMSSANRAAWVRWGADSGMFAGLGGKQGGSGRAAFMGMRYWVARLGGDADTGVPGQGPVEGMSNVVVTGSAGGQSVLVSLVPDPVPDDVGVVVFAEVLRGAGVRRWGWRGRFVGALAPGSAGPHEVGGGVVDVWGQLLQGQIVSVRLLPYSFSVGKPGASYFGVCTVGP